MIFRYLASLPSFSAWIISMTHCAFFQGLRAIAIFGVLLFHLAPKRFVNGFLGVDTWAFSKVFLTLVPYVRFFVLSGYLMSSILSRESTINGAVVKSFYIRRFKRIVPLYSIMLVMLAVRFFQNNPSKWNKSNHLFPVYGKIGLGW